MCSKCINGIIISPYLETNNMSFFQHVYYGFFIELSKLYPLKLINLSGERNLYINTERKEFLKEIQSLPLPENI